MSPPLAVLATLLLILLTPRRVPLWASFLAACVALPLWCGFGLAQSALQIGESASRPETLVFAAVCAGVFLLSSVLTHGGHLAAICDFASSAVRNRRIRAAIMPALVGLVPMPGGAAVSAPLLDRSLGDASVSPTDRNLINYWFRHVWEVSWPLYPAVLLAATYEGAGSRVPFAVAQFPLTVVLLIAGYFALLRRVPKGTDQLGTRATPGGLRALVPLGILVAVPLLWTRTGTLGPFEGLVVGVLAAIAAAALTAVDPSGLRLVPRDRRVFAMTALAFLVKVFGDLVTTTGGSRAIGDLISASGLPFVVAAALLPFFIGFASGATLTFVTVAFPVLVPPAAGSLPLLVLAYAGGFVGYLTSPVHMCLVLSTRYFNSRLAAAYGRLAIPILAFLAAAIGLFAMLGGRFDA